MKRKLWGSLTSWELSCIIDKNPVLVLPVGSFEQHGAHLPVDTDTHIGNELALQAVEKATYPCLLLPPLWMGIAEHHMYFSGTITISYNTLYNLLKDITRSYVRHGGSKLLLLNSHGGNVAPLKTAVNEIHAELDLEIVLVTYWDLVSHKVMQLRKSPLGGISHACELETSLKLYLRPEDVRKELTEPHVVPGNHYLSPEMFSSNKITVPMSFEELSSKGHIGDPTKACSEFGKAVFEEAVKELSRIINLFGEGKLW